MAKFSDAHTKEYYESFSDVYAAFGSHQIHAGFFDREKTLEQASEDMNAFLAELADLPAGASVLDVGCGRGGTDRFLMRERSARVVGIDLSARQLTEAKKSADDEGLAEHLTYLEASMTAIPLEGESMDCVWLQEALMHCHDKAQAVREFSRVLKPSGVVVLQEKILGRPQARAEVMEVYGQRLKLNELYTAEQYRRMFHEHDFSLGRNEDLSSHLLCTYSAILEHLRSHRENVRGMVAKKYWPSLDRDFDLSKTLRLVEEGKLGCVAMVFTKRAA